MYNLIELAWAIFISIVVAYIALLQFHLGKDRLRNDLFDRRMEIFRKTQAFISKANLGQKREKSQTTERKFDESDLNEMKEAFHESIFLFDEEISEYLGQMWDNGRKYLETNRDESEKRVALSLIADQYKDVFELFKNRMAFESLNDPFYTRIFKKRRNSEK